MKAKLSIVLDELHGSAGNVTAKTSDKGQIILKKVAPKNPKTQLQQTSRMRFSSFARLWKKLSNEQRQSWIDVAEKPQTGYQIFNERNTNLNTINKPFIESYHSAIASSVVTNIEVYIKHSDGRLYAKINLSQFSSSESVLLYVSKYSTTNVSFLSFNLVIADYCESLNEVILDITDLYINQFYNLPPIDSFIGVRANVIDNYSGYKSASFDKVVKVFTYHPVYYPTVSKNNFNCEFIGSPSDGRFDMSIDLLLSPDVPFAGLTALFTCSFIVKRTDAEEDIRFTHNLEIGENSLHFEGSVLASSFYYPLKKGDEIDVGLLLRIEQLDGSMKYSFRDDDTVITI